MFNSSFARSSFLIAALIGHVIGSFGQGTSTAFEPFMKTIEGDCFESFWVVSPNVTGDHFMTAGRIEHRYYPNSSGANTYNCAVLTDGTCENNLTKCWRGLIARVHVDGFILNSWTWGEQGLFGVMSGIRELNDGSFIVMGDADDGSLNGSDPNIRFYKFNAQGQSIWGLNLGDGSTTVSAQSFSKTQDDGFLLIGRVRLPTDPLKERNAFMAKVDANGNVVFSNYWRSGIGYDQFASITEVPDGYVCGGYTNHRCDIVPPDTFCYQIPMLIKYDMNGDVVWSYSYDHPALENSLAQRSETVLSNPDGSIVASFNTEDGIILFKVNPYGDLIWMDRYDGPGWEQHRNLIHTHSGNLLVGGQVLVDDPNHVLADTANALLMEIDQQGQLLRSQNLANALYQQIITMMRFEQNGCKGYMCVGAVVDQWEALPNSTFRDEDPWVVKMNEDLGGFTNCVITPTGINSYPIDITQVSRQTLVSSNNTAWNVPLGFPASVLQNTSVLYHLSSDTTRECVPAVSATAPCVVGSEDISLIVSQRISIHPNPSNGQFLITTNQAHRIKKVSVMTSIGQPLNSTTERIDHRTCQMQVNAPVGSYYVRVDFDDGSMEVGKVFITEQQ